MKFLFWVASGFAGGVIVSRNAATLPSPVIGSIFVAMIVSCGYMWYLGYHGKSEAVSIAVSQATAVANARANANAKAIANSAINLYLGQQAGVTPEIVGSIVNRSLEQGNEYSLSYGGESFGEKETA